MISVFGWILIIFGGILGFVLICCFTVAMISVIGIYRIMKRKEELEMIEWERRERERIKEIKNE